MIWITLHSIALVAFTVSLLAGSAPAVAASLLACESALAFAVLIAGSGRQALRPANALTGIRLVVAVMFLALAGAPVPGQSARVALFAVAIGAEITDFFDGRIARRLGPTAFGAKLDMETDALFMLALSLVLLRWFELPGWIVAAGLARYVFAIPFLLLPEPRFPPVFSRFAKLACATAVVTLIATAAPIAAPWFATVQVIAGAVAVASLLLSFAWEAALRIRASVSQPVEGTVLRGLARSILTYYGVPFRQLAMRRFYRTFVGDGDLVFDVGAHVGNRVQAFRALGARVVAVEPQPACVRLLERLHGADPEVTIVDSACGANERVATMLVSRAHPTLSTLSVGWTRDIGRHYAGHAIEWDREVEVRTTTLDAMIGRHGVPDFVKIDVEGYEADVLTGLSHVVHALSFEFLPASIEPALESVDTLERLGRYRYAYSLVETMRFAIDWVGAGEIRSLLRAMPANGRSGDVYAVLEERR